MPHPHRDTRAPRSTRCTGHASWVLLSRNKIRTGAYARAMDCERGVQASRAVRRAPVTGRRAFFRGLSPLATLSLLQRTSDAPSHTATHAPHPLTRPQPIEHCRSQRPSHGSHRRPRDDDGDRIAAWTEIDRGSGEAMRRVRQAHAGRLARTFCSGRRAGGIRVPCGTCRSGDSVVAHRAEPGSRRVRRGHVRFAHRSPKPVGELSSPATGRYSRRTP